MSSVVDRQRYVVHLTVVAADLPAAELLARSIARSLAFLPDVRMGETTVSEVDDQGVQRQVFCDRLLGGRRRCVRRTDHPGNCTS
ncbi:hypothetical protein [Micromonospora echinofusca]|uniref:hypothetical protein n=1 Tax=Micromonospora echinofusca TaxID=47858 RepID=UPI0027DD4C39|nr:hypothetical protein [Micromonospora echinofusca]